MEITIKDKICKKNNIDIAHALVLGAINYGNDTVYQELIRKGYITIYNKSFRELHKQYSITNKGLESLNNIILDSDTIIEAKINVIQELAKQLRDIYPSGKMPGTSYYYKCNTTDIEKKLKSFYKRYGSTYSNEQIITATKKYVESKNGNYSYLKLLKYFIWKDEIRDGEIISTSMLADYLENEGQEESLTNDWTTELK